MSRFFTSLWPKQRNMHCENVCVFVYTWVEVNLTCPVCLQMLIWAPGFEGSISRAAFLEAADLWCWMPWPFLTGSPLCRITMIAPLPRLRSERFIDAAKRSVHLTCISSHIQSSEPSLFPRKRNARTRLRTPRPFQSRTGRRRLHHKPDVCRGCGMEVQEAYLHGLVVPAVRPVLLAAPAVQHEQGPVAVPGLQTTGLVQTHHTEAGLDKAQRIPVSLIWIVDEKWAALVVWRMLRSKTAYEDGWHGNCPKTSRLLSTCTG